MVSCLNLKVVTFNILAPSWVTSKIYPSSCLDEYYDPHRLGLKISYIKKYLSKADLYCLQETQRDENVIIANAFPEYIFCAVYHDDMYWETWKNSESIFVPNGVSVGINSKRFTVLSFNDLSLHTGNHASVVICEHRKTQNLIRVSAIHLDDKEMKFSEIYSLVEYLDSDPGRYIDIIAGDFNSNIRSFSILQMAGFRDVILNDTMSTPNPLLGAIDHVVVRGPVAPLSGKIHQLGDYCQTVKINGSDHYAVECNLGIIVR